jgi:hypothetical protein
MLLNLHTENGNIVIIPAQRFIIAEGPEAGPTKIMFTAIPPTDPPIGYSVKETPSQLMDVLKTMVGGGCGQNRVPQGMPIPQQPPVPAGPRPNINFQEAKRDLK